jgi:hypothetical protein
MSLKKYIGISPLVYRSTRVEAGSFDSVTSTPALAKADFRMTAISSSIWSPVR